MIRHKTPVLKATLAHPPFPYLCPFPLHFRGAERSFNTRLLPTLTST